MKLTAAEEKKIASRKGYRTSARTLRKLATEPMVFELAQTNGGDWDRFQLRNIGLAAQRRMAGKYNGNVERFRRSAVKRLLRIVKIDDMSWPASARSALNDFAVALTLVEDLPDWKSSDKKALLQIIRAKAADDESRYLKLMQTHARLRRAMLECGND
jgi:hypothetical protein